MAYYKTSDGNVFYNRNTAENHAKTLRDRKVEETDQVPEKSFIKKERVNKHESVVEETKVESSEQSEVSEYDNLTKKELLDIASELGLTASDRSTKQQIILLVTNAKKSQ